MDRRTFSKSVMAAGIAAVAVTTKAQNSGETSQSDRQADLVVISGSKVQLSPRLVKTLRSALQSAEDRGLDLEKLNVQLSDRWIKCWIS
jgi:hypothetical protein